jgi:origin recognition complex subunit 2
MDSEIKSRFNFLHYSIPTFEHYSIEAKYSQPIMTGGFENELAANGLRYILKSVNPNGRNIFKILAEHQLSTEDLSGLTFKKYYEKCREAFLVNNEMTMKSQLTEFRDHKVILSKRTADEIYFFIPISPSLLKQIVEEME